MHPIEFDFKAEIEMYPGRRHEQTMQLLGETFARVQFTLISINNTEDEALGYLEAYSDIGKCVTRYVQLGTGIVLEYPAGLKKIEEKKIKITHSGRLLDVDDNEDGRYIDVFCEKDMLKDLFAGTLKIVFKYKLQGVAEAKVYSKTFKIKKLLNGQTITSEDFGEYSPT